jgi:hypothetical protein
MRVVVLPLAAMAADRPDLEPDAMRLLALAHQRAYGRAADERDPDWSRAVEIFEERVRASARRGAPSTTLATTFAAALQHGWRGGDPGDQNVFAQKIRPMLGRLQDEAALDAACAALADLHPDEQRQAVVPVAWSIYRRGVGEGDLLDALGWLGLTSEHLKEIPE